MSYNAAVEECNHYQFAEAFRYCKLQTFCPSFIFRHFTINCILHYIFSCSFCTNSNKFWYWSSSNSFFKKTTFVDRHILEHPILRNLPYDYIISHTLERIFSKIFLSMCPNLLIRSCFAHLEHNFLENAWILSRWHQTKDIFPSPYDFKSLIALDTSTN